MKIKIFLPLLLCLAIAFAGMPLASCGAERKFTANSLDLFDTVTVIIGYESDKARFDEVSGEILTALEQYHRLFTAYECFDGMENICSVNQTAGKDQRTVKVDDRIIDMLLFAKQMHALTGGSVNVAMGSVLSLWHECREQAVDLQNEAKIPSMDELRAATQHTDIDKLVIDEQEGTVTLADPLMTLDVGAIAKGYAVEEVAKLLESKGVEGYCINVGGNVRVIGNKPSGEAWTVGVRHPSDENEYIAQVPLSNAALVTSGDYQRFFTVDGVKYHHIIDPDTLLPSIYFSSVSVICHSAAMADALSTALFCMTLDEGIELVGSMDGVEAVWVTPDGEITRSEQG